MYNALNLQNCPLSRFLSLYKIKIFTPIFIFQLLQGSYVDWFIYISSYMHLYILNTYFKDLLNKAWYNNILHISILIILFYVILYVINSIDGKYKDIKTN